MKPRLLRSSAPWRSASRPWRGPRAARICCRSTARRCAPIPRIAAAKANWEATQEKAPQARAGLAAERLGVGQRQPSTTTTRRSRPIRGRTSTAISTSTTRSCRRRSRCSAIRISMLYDQAKQQVTQADYVLEFRAAGPDRPRRRRVFRHPARRSSTSSSPRARRRRSSEQLAQAKRNFEVGVATITDTNEAQAKYDAIVAQEITVRNEYDNRVTALRAIIGRYPKDLKKLGARASCRRCPSPMSPITGSTAR